MARPHEHDSTETLKQALTRTSKDAQRYAQTGPKAWEDAMHRSRTTSSTSSSSEVRRDGLAPGARGYPAARSVSTPSEPSGSRRGRRRRVADHPVASRQPRSLTDPAGSHRRSQLRTREAISDHIPYLPNETLG